MKPINFFVDTIRIQRSIDLHSRICTRPDGGPPFIVASKLAAKRLIERINRGERV